MTVVIPPGSGSDAFPCPGLGVLIRALDQSNDGILITDAAVQAPGPTIVYVNAAYEAISGYSRAELVGRSPRVLQGPATDRALLDRLRIALEAGQSFHAEAINYRKDGTPYWVEWDIAPVREDNGTVAWFISIQREVTRRREAEEALGRTLTALRASNDRLRDLGAVLSHDLQQPLGVVRGYLDLLRSRHAETLGKDAAWLDSALAGADAMTARVRGLLEEAARLDSTGEAVDLDPVVGAVLDDLRPDLDTVGADIRVDPLPAVMGFPGELREVFHNLLTNAVKYRAPDRLLRVGVSGQRIHDALVQVAVTDTGLGIPTDRQTAVFDRGNRGAAPADVTGTGLGLFFVRSAIERTGGKVALHSTPGVGTTVLLTLPAA